MTSRTRIGSIGCPSCQSQGRDHSGNHLMIHDDGFGHCARCKFTTEDYTSLEPSDRPKKLKERVSRMNLSDVEEMISLPIPQRKLTATTVEHFGVKIGLDDDGDPDEYYIPVTKKGEITGYKVKGYDKDDPDRFSKRPVGDVKGDVELFGQSVCKGAQRRLIITEGQEDAMAVWQMLRQHQQGSKYNDSTVHAVSLQMGSGSAAKAIKDNWSFISKYKEIILALDNDDPGQEASMEITKALGYKNVKIMNWSGYKDPGEMNISGKRGRECFIEAYFSAKAYKPTWYLRGEDITLDWLKKPVPKGLDIPFKSLCDKLRGFRFGELTTYTSGPGMGKTTLVKQITYYLNTLHKCKIGRLHLEETAQKAVHSLAGIHYKIPPRDLQEDPSLLTDKQWKSFQQEVLSNECVVDHFGSMAIEDVMDRLHYLWAVEGCNVIVVDHLSLIMSGNREADERKQIDILMTELASFVVKTQVMMHCIVHIKRKDKKSVNRGGQIDIQDLRGSSSLEGISWNVIALERDTMSTSASNEVTPIVLKNREGGTLGPCSPLIYNPKTGLLENKYQTE